MSCSCFSLFFVKYLIDISIIYNKYGKEVSMKKAHIIIDILILVTLIAILIFGLIAYNDLMNHLKI